MRVIGQQTAAEKLRSVVRALTRAKRRQVLLDHAWAGLCCALLLSCIAVLVLRLGIAELPYTAGTVVAGFVAAGLLVAALIAWQHRPSELQVAIVADVQLNLKQRLSTAWEFNQLASQPEISEQLAMQAVRARLPAQSERVFPLRINTWGRFTPVVAALLILLAIVDLQRVTGSTIADIDQSVVAQGAQLREYGQQMQARVRSENLSRSLQAAQNIQRLGSRMESGDLSRQQALHRLQDLSTALSQQRQSALQLDQGSETRIAPQQIETLGSQTVQQGIALRATLEDLAEGRRQTDDVQFSKSDLRALSQHGISQQDLEAALDELAGGNDRELQQILETLAKVGEAAREAKELEQARQKLEQARENLGDNNANTRTGANRGGQAVNAGSDDIDGEGGGNENNSGERSMEDYFADDRPSATGLGSGRNRQGSNQQQSPFKPEDNADGTIVKPASQIREGNEFTSEARVLPRLVKATLDSAELDIKFNTQVEEALAKDSYPLHHKELIRRYFLTLSEGVAVTPQQSP